MEEIKKSVEHLKSHKAVNESNKTNNVTINPKVTKPRLLQDDDDKVPIGLTEEQINKRNYKKALLKKPLKEREDFNAQNKYTITETAAKIMSEISTAIGFKGITPEMIRNWEWNGDDDDIEKVPEDQLFKDEKYSEARTFLIHFLSSNK